MSMKELYQAKLNEVLNHIQQDAILYFTTPPEDISKFDLEDWEEKAREYHQNGEVGAYIYFSVMFAILKEGNKKK